MYKSGLFLHIFRILSEQFVCCTSEWTYSTYTFSIRVEHIPWTEKNSCWGIVIKTKRRNLMVMIFQNKCYDSLVIAWNGVEIKHRGERASSAPKGRLSGPLSMNFWKSSKRPLTPPRPFLGKMLRFFPKSWRPALNLQRNFLDRKWPPPYFKVFPEIHDQKCSF